VIETIGVAIGRQLDTQVLVERMLRALTAVCSEAAQPGHAIVVARSNALALVVRHSYEWCVDGTTTPRVAVLAGAVAAARSEMHRFARQGRPVGALPERVEELNEAVVALARVVDHVAEEPGEQPTHVRAVQDVGDQPVIEVRRLPALRATAGTVRGARSARPRKRLARALEWSAAITALALAVATWCWITHPKQTADPTEHNRELLRSQSDQPGLIVPGVFSARRAAPSPPP
jgi:hypothetical protein